MILKVLYGAAALAGASVAVAQPVADLGQMQPLGGSWTYAPASDGAQAAFRDSANRPQLVIHCTRSLRRITISKPASAPATALQIWTSSATRSAPAGYDAANARLNVALSALDPLLDAIAFSRGRFGVTVAGAPPLVLPAWPEAARVIEECRV